MYYRVKYTGYYEEVKKYNPYKIINNNETIARLFLMQSLKDSNKIFGASKRELEYLGTED